MPVFATPSLGAQMFQDSTDETAVTILSKHGDGLSATTGTLAIRVGDKTLHAHYKTDAKGLGNEAHLLRTAAQATNQIKGIVPLRLVAFLEDRNMLVTEYVEQYQKAFTWLWNQSSWLPFKRQASCLTPEQFGERLGLWLRAFHNAASIEGIEWATIVQDTIERALEKCEALENLPDTRSRFLSLLRDVHAYLLVCLHDHASWPRGPIGHLHGDFTLMNLGVRPNGEVVVFDFGDTRPACMLEDFVRVWHDLHVVAKTTGKRRRFVERCTKSLSQAYAPDLQQNCKMVNLVSIWNALINFHVLLFGYKHMGRLACLWVPSLLRAYELSVVEILQREPPFVEQRDSSGA